MIRILRQAVHKAQAENRRRGVANVYVINGQRYWELPSGELSPTPPTTTPTPTPTSDS